LHSLKLFSESPCNSYAKIGNDIFWTSFLRPDLQSGPLKSKPLLDYH